MAFLSDGKCWAHGAVALGHYFAGDMVRCRRCNRKCKGQQIPMWFEGEPLHEAECLDCLRRRHDGCPCGFVLEAEERDRLIKAFQGIELAE